MSKVSRKQSWSKLVLIKGERVIVAVDVHKGTFHVAVWSLQRGLLVHWVQPASAKILLARLEPIGAQVEQVVYEAGPTGFGLARAVMAAGLAVLVAAPSQIPALPGRQPKTDRLDAIRLAELAAQGLLKAACIPSEREEADRQVGRLREQLTRKVRRCKQQIKSFLLFHGLEEPRGLKDWTRGALDALRALELDAELRFCLDELLDELDFLTGRLRRATERLAALARSERHREAVARLRQQAGVGLITAMTFRLELVQPERFDHGGQVARATGLAPGVRRSGKTARGGPILKSGNPRIRAVLVEAAWRAIRSDADLRRRWLRLCRNTASAKKAIVGIARHLARRLWRRMLAPDGNAAAVQAA